MKFRFYAFAAALVLCAAASADRFSAGFENDVVFHKDCDYTHATKLGYELDSGLYFGIGQNMYTPDDKKNQEPVYGQHPYAGYLYGEIGYSPEGIDSHNYFGLQLGLVGPHSYAEQTQKLIHRWLGCVRPAGWEWQLKDEFIFNFVYGRKDGWTLVGERGGWSVMGILKEGAVAGLANDYAYAGAELRFGFNPKIGRSDDIFIVADAKGAEKRPAFYGIAAGEFRAVAYNIFLDGNYHRDSYVTVDSKWDVWDGRLGFGYELPCGMDARVLWVWRTKEYEGQRKNPQFASIEVGWTF